MGGAGGASDGRFFNVDNQNSTRRTERGEDAREDRENEDRYPPELASIRDVFTNLFGGMGDGPANMLVDLFGGGVGRGRTGDYVWGQQGLDDVITQLMEQTRGSTAQPPASEEAIAKLERFSRSDKAKLNQARNRECSTCMDSFQEEEQGEDGMVVEPSMDSNRLSSTLGGGAAKGGDEADDPPEVVPLEEQQDELVMMPCRHLFHEDCLIPWLKTNRTCPVCRIILEPEKGKGEEEAQGTGSVNPDAASSSSAGGPSHSQIDEHTTDDEDESPEAIRERSRRAAEDRFARQSTGNIYSNAAQRNQTVPGSFLQPDDLD
jgi:E3 ubiquitin-protein ligase RNF115/126